MIDPSLDIVEVNYSLNKKFKMLLLRGNEVNVEECNRYGINAI